MRHPPPLAPLRPCGHAGCPALVAHGTYCPPHKRQHQRPGSYTRGYGPTWRRLRRQYLRENPTCRECGGPATQVDHRVPVSRGADMYDQSNWQPLCAHCHSTKTVRQDWGFGAAPKDKP